MSADLTAAERARRYRARRRDAVTSRDVTGAELVAVMGRVADRLEELVELVRESYPQSPGDVDNRDGIARHAGRRDVTERHGPEVAPAYARRDTLVATLSTRRVDRESSDTESDSHRDASRHGDELAARVSDPLVDSRARILEALDGRAPHTVAAIADATGLAVRDAAAELVVLAGLGRVRRIAAESPSGRDRWELVPAVATSPSETIACTAYREHQLAHRRDPGSGRFRCYICEPDGRPTPPADHAPAPPA